MSTTNTGLRYKLFFYDKNKIKLHSLVRRQGVGYLLIITRRVNIYSTIDNSNDVFIIVICCSFSNKHFL